MAEYDPKHLALKSTRGKNILALRREKIRLCIVGLLGLFLAGCGSRGPDRGEHAAAKTPSAEAKEAVLVAAGIPEPSRAPDMESPLAVKEEGRLPSDEGPTDEPTPSASPDEDKPRFDHRALGREGQAGLSFKASWEGSISLWHSKFGCMKLAVTFDLTEQKAADAFRPRAAAYRGLSDCIKDVFRMRRSSELQGVRALEDRREDLIAVVNKFFGSTVVREAYFAEYSLGFR